MPAPHLSLPGSVAGVMIRVMIALVPAVAAHAWLYGPGIVIALTVASVAALASEALMLKLRRVPVRPFLSDGSALATAWLLALALPSLAPWWLVAIGTVFAIVVAKHLYGGLGNNLFNPAMVGYAVLIISFPAHMTRWPAPALAGPAPGLPDAVRHIFGAGLPPGAAPDAVTMATPLDFVKTQLQTQHTLPEILTQGGLPAAAFTAPEILALAYLAGGLFLLQQRVITWHVPVTYLAVLALLAAAFHSGDPDRYAGALFHLSYGAAAMGAFFILTDPVSGSTTAKGRFIFAAGAALLTYLIRTFGGYPDGVAFAVLLMNMCVPLIDAYTQPTVYGKGRRAGRGDRP